MTTRLATSAISVRQQAHPPPANVGADLRSAAGAAAPSTSSAAPMPSRSPPATPNASQRPAPRSGPSVSCRAYSLTASTSVADRAGVRRRRRQRGARAAQRRCVGLGHLPCVSTRPRRAAEAEDARTDEAGAARHPPRPSSPRSRPVAPFASRNASTASTSSSTASSSVEPCRGRRQRRAGGTRRPVRPARARRGGSWRAAGRR